MTVNAGRPLRTHCWGQMSHTWTEDLACGIPEIDQQHRELFRRLADLLAAMKEGRGRDVVSASLSYLSTYVVEHFSAEERLMKLRRYPDEDAHRRLHEGFVQDVRRLREQLDRDGATSLLVIQVQRRVGEWLVNHIGRFDRDLARFCKSAGAGR